MKDHVLEKKYEITRPQDEDGVDMWVPLPSFLSASPDDVHDNKRRKVPEVSLSPKYSAHSPKYAPVSPVYDQ